MPWGTPLERFNAKVHRTGDCWVWVGGHKAAGYGQFSVGGRKVIAHRWAYDHFVGPIPDGYEVDHLCRNKSCVRPTHLEAITLRENRRRRVKAKVACVHGHRYTEATTGWQRDAAGYWSRVCLTCHPGHSRHRGMVSPAD